MGSDGGVVDIERMKRANDDFRGVGRSGELLEDTSQSLGHVDPVLPQDSVQVFLVDGTPVERDVSGVDGIASGVQWLAARG